MRASMNGGYANGSAGELKNSNCPKSIISALSFQPAAREKSIAMRYAIRYCEMQQARNLENNEFQRGRRGPALSAQCVFAQLPATSSVMTKNLNFLPDWRRRPTALAERQREPRSPVLARCPW